MAFVYCAAQSSKIKRIPLRDLVRLSAMLHQILRSWNIFGGAAERPFELTVGTS
jgi:hypothetical protein